MKKETLKVMGQPLSVKNRPILLLFHKGVKPVANSALPAFVKSFQDGSARTGCFARLLDILFLLLLNGQVVADCNSWTISINNLSSGL